MKEIIEKIMSFGDWFIGNAFKKEFLQIININIVETKKN